MDYLHQSHCKKVDKVIEYGTAGFRSRYGACYFQLTRTGLYSVVLAAACLRSLHYLTIGTPVCVLGNANPGAFLKPRVCRFDGLQTRV